MFEVIYKYLLIVFLILLFVLVSFSAYIFIFEEIDSSIISIHKISGVLLIFVALVHTLIKRKKLKKLTKEFLNIFLGKKVSLDSDMDLLLDSLQNKTIDEICSIFNIGFQDLEELFEKNNIVYSSKEQTLHELSKNNSYKVFPIIVKIIEYKSK
jgi:hypothetical protein